MKYINKFINLKNNKLNILYILYFKLINNREKNMFIIIVNGGLYGCEKYNNREEVKKELLEWSCGEEIEDEDDDIISVDDIIDGGMMDVYNSNMVEMGDDFISINVVEIK